MKTTKNVLLVRMFGIIALVAVIGFSFVACSNGSDPGDGNQPPVNPAGNQTPVASDYTFGNMSQTAGSVTAVTITANSDKSPGAVSNIRYNNSATIPQATGTYAVTFDVTAATGWNAATGLSAGNLTVNPVDDTTQTPVASDYTFGNMSQTAGSVTTVTITANSDKSPGAVSNIRYSNSITIPQTAGTYAVSFDVAAATGWNAVSGLSAGNLTVIPLPPPEMVQIQGGTFTMGSPTGEPRRFSGEIQHQVTLTGFYLSKYQVTQAQYQAVMGNNPSAYRVGGSRAYYLGGITDTTNFPVESVSWYDALVFCNKLSMNEGLDPAYRISGSTDPTEWGTAPEDGNATWNAVEVVDGSNGYRLPTEAQWEFACRAETTTAFNWGTDTINSTQANYYARDVDELNTTTGTSLERTTVVGSYVPNAWDLYDMHGNVWEWCWDRKGEYTSSAQTDPTGGDSDSNRMYRGGSYGDGGPYLRSAYRISSIPNHGSYATGFRLVHP
jgi:formylglycine-generating enzyme required for sulfatase activity